MKRKLITMLIMCIAVTSLTSCKKNEDKDPLLDESKDSLVAMVRDQQSQINNYVTQVEDLETKLKGVLGEDVPPEAISTIGDGTGRLTFNSYKNTITFPELFLYPDGISAPADDRVSIVNGVTFSPSSNWVINLDGTTAEVEHKSNITGTFKVVAYNDVYDKEILKVRIDEWLATLPPDDAIQYTRIFVADNFCGYDVLSQNSMIDEEPAVLRVGMIAYGQKAVSYAFVYRGEDDPIKDEAVKSLISSIQINTSELRME